MCYYTCTYNIYIYYTHNRHHRLSSSPSLNFASQHLGMSLPPPHCQPPRHSLTWAFPSPVTNLRSRAIKKAICAPWRARHGLRLGLGLRRLSGGRVSGAAARLGCPSTWHSSVRRSGSPTGSATWRHRMVVSGWGGCFFLGREDGMGVRDKGL